MSLKTNEALPFAYDAGNQFITSSLQFNAGEVALAGLGIGVGTFIFVKVGEAITRRRDASQLPE